MIDFANIKIFNADLIQILSIISLNIYFKRKISHLLALSLIDKIFNYCVLAFASNIMLGNEL